MPSGFLMSALNSASADNILKGKYEKASPTGEALKVIYLKYDEVLDGKARDSPLIISCTFVLNTLVGVLNL